MYKYNTYTYTYISTPASTHLIPRTTLIIRTLALSHHISPNVSTENARSDEKTVNVSRPTRPPLPPTETQRQPTTILAPRVAIPTKAKAMLKATTKMTRRHTCDGMLHCRGLGGDSLLVEIYYYAIDCWKRSLHVMVQYITWGWEGNFPVEN